MAGKKPNKKSRNAVDVDDVPVDKTTINDAADCTEDQAPAMEAAEQQDATEVMGKLRQEVEEWKDKYLRAKAEQQNAARRSANELQDSLKYANANLLRSLLEVVDDFERTVEASAAAESIDSVVAGMKLIEDKVEKLLRDSHVVAINADRVPFDPARHAALMQQPSTEHEPGTVIQQVQKGYLFHDRVLRPAQVIVAAAPPEQTNEAANSSSDEREDAVDAE